MRILLVVYDNGSYISWFPQGLAYIAAVLKKAGHDVEIYNQDVYHYSDEHLTEHLKRNKYDMLGISIIAGYYQYRKLLSLSRAINEVPNRPYYVIGGHGPSPEPEYFLRKTGADAVVIGEGEVTILQLIDAIEGNKKMADVKGIAYLDNDKLVQTERQPLIENIDTIPMPAYEMFPMDHYALLRLPNIKAAERCMPILSGRGCTFTCNFCYRMDTGFRPRSAESIIEEIQLLKKDYNIHYIAFGDELLMNSIKRTEELCNAFIKARLNITWDCNGRLNYAKPDVLRLMKQAGCVFINYGIEAADDTVLRNMNKALTMKQIIIGVENTIAAGISPGLNIIFGNIGDNRETLQKGVDFLLKYDDLSQLRTVRPVTPYPGSPLYYHAIEKGLLKDVEDFYEHKHLNSDLLAVNFTDMTDEDFHKALLVANKTLLKRYYDSNLQNGLKAAEKLY
ncbi:B12-binding domain-containing radical SAM protein, partial [bacterium]|nr:B12-binding domain-containing radical SAM protein [bacterium]